MREREDGPNDQHEDREEQQLAVRPQVLERVRKRVPLAPGALGPEHPECADDCSHSSISLTSEENGRMRDADGRPLKGVGVAARSLPFSLMWPLAVDRTASTAGSARKLISCAGSGSTSTAVSGSSSPMITRSSSDRTSRPVAVAP